MEFKTYLNPCGNLNLVKIKKIKLQKRSHTTYHNFIKKNFFLYHSGFTKFFSYFFKSIYLNIMYLIKYSYNLAFYKNNFNLTALNFFFFTAFLNISKKKFLLEYFDKSIYNNFFEKKLLRFDFSTSNVSFLKKIYTNFFLEKPYLTSEKYVSFTSYNNFDFLKTFLTGEDNLYQCKYILTQPNLIFNKNNFMSCIILDNAKFTNLMLLNIFKKYNFKLYLVFLYLFFLKKSF